MTTKRRSIISYDKLTVEQKKKLEHDFPEGFLGNLTTIKTPTGEVLDALIWETEEIIYLVKINKASFHSSLDDEDDDFVDDTLGADIPVGDDDDESDDDDDIDEDAEEDDEEDEDEDEE
ncbi:hypothetical protein H9Y05_02270 [Crocinitomicaceae bacterium CZZ-1]|uniref:Uncharacterized protein n=1 Tax=Taishania pollutisoli TaxID=2766479 RepID=A0A8J6TWP7_9FLAO|nr:hypothetical protein [Taishania pollutisoli]MBC9811291.1 hypothetical protein [Taishania pollutisoli]MBX2947794.1 hypothetical protein [Crocinitomicaceae bacterium]